MSIIVSNDLPAKKILEDENIFVIDENRAHTQNIRPLQIAILNLMPLKEDTELDILRVMSNFPIQTQITLLAIASHESTHTTASHLNQFYLTYEDVKDNYYDGLIITGAPVEKIDFEDVDYWPELAKIMEWSRSHVYSSFHLCWGAQAGLYYHHQIQKIMLPEKLSGVYRHKVLHHKKMLMRGMDDYFMSPQSRYTGIDEAAVAANPELYVVAEGENPEEKVGSCLILAYSSRQIFMMGHTEYDRYDLDKEYKRDLAKGIEPQMPVNYYPDDDPSKKPELNWRSSSNALYTNWLNVVYQGTPFDLTQMPKLEEDSYTLSDETDTLEEEGK